MGCEVEMQVLGVRNGVKALKCGLGGENDDWMDREEETEGNKFGRVTAR